MRENAEKFIKKVNQYWMDNFNVEDNRPFWEQSAYHIGNLAAYEATKNESYLEYSKKWSIKAGWRGHPYDGPKENWTYAYGEENERAVLFGDWHASYQVYLDLYEIDGQKNDEWIKHATEVIDHQMTTLRDSYWWWCDGLFMGMPVLTKFYRLTEDPKYLNKLFEYFLFSMELMYDGENGIPTHKDGYLSSAYEGGPYGGKKAVVASDFADPNDYKNLFYRDGNFPYPSSPLPGDLAEIKNFWSRGNGWVVAALIRVLRELPKDWPHYGFFQRVFIDMVEAVSNSQKIDRDGNGFWTQSMLAHDFSCSEENPEGYETSGTAFFTFALFAGMNDGLLSEEKYLDVATRGWKYLENVAMQEDGKIGYAQWVGAAAGEAATYENTQDFAVGGALLAAVEVMKFGKNN